MSLFGELKRRNVFRVGVAYLAACWLLFEVLSGIFGVIGSPEWLMQSILALMAVGFPVALLFSWAYEMTPEGLMPTHQVDASASITHSTGRRLDQVTIALVVLALGFLLADRMGWLPRATPQATAPVAADSPSTAAEPAGEDTEPTVAVLPFANLSDDAANEYFADGVAEEVLNLLARSEDLRVISRSSAFTFKGQSVPIPQIATSLGATHLLEGSIRRAGNRVRVTAQLIEAAGDVHLWSETFDRELTDIFAVQDEIAQAIARALAINLASTPGRVMDLPVYELILEARALAARRQEDGLRRGLELLQEAVRVAPDNAEARGQLALAQMLMANWYLRDAESLAKTGQYAREALELDPDNVSALTAQGSWQLFSMEFEAAETSFRRALAINPNSVDAVNWYGDFLMITRRLDEALATETRAVRLDPLLAVHRLNVGFVHDVAHDVDAAVEAYEQAIELDPRLIVAYRCVMALLIFERRFDALRRFSEDHRGSLPAEVTHYLTLAEFIESGRLEEARSWIDGLSDDWEIFNALRLVHRNQGAEIWDLAARILRERDRGYPFYLWPSFAAHTRPDILAQSEAYRAFWMEPPRDRLLRARGHREAVTEDGSR